MTKDEIRALRESLALSQQGFAERINAVDSLLRANRNIVSRWERGVNKPSPHALAAMRQLEEDTDEK